jgi:hypothetical protein
MRIKRSSFKHAFAAVLDEAARDSGEAAEEVRATPAAERDGALMRALEGLVETPDEVPDPAPPAAAYRDEIEAREAFVTAESTAAPPPAQRPLEPGLAVEELNRERRRLAFANHPDRVPPERREAASRAMAEINAEIDRAIGVRKKGAPR